MWKAYISDSFKNDRAAGIAVMAAGFLSALMLSPVSYTHLDVYKRQLLFWPGRGRCTVGASGRRGGECRECFHGLKDTG